jgi:hypothetical protein
LFHLQGEEKMEAKLLISIEKVRIFGGQPTDSGTGPRSSILLHLGLECAILNQGHIQIESYDLFWWARRVDSRIERLHRILPILGNALGHNS